MGRVTAHEADANALRVIAAAGADGVELDQPFTDEQADALRNAFEQLPLDSRQTLGPGVGRAVRFAAVTYDSTGESITTTARPCDAYIIEKEAHTWRGGRWQDSWPHLAP
jgi:hypothetical protein